MSKEYGVSKIFKGKEPMREVCEVLYAMYGVYSRKRCYHKNALQVIKSWPAACSYLEMILIRPLMDAPQSLRKSIGPLTCHSSCVVKTQRRWSNKIYKTELTKKRYNNQVLGKYRVDPQRAGLTLIAELTWSNLGLKGVLNKRKIRCKIWKWYE